MARCPSCDNSLPEEREKVGSRCPNCHDPIYEPPTRFPRPAREEEATCAVHPGMESVGTCGRCGNYLCETCRTRWRGKVWCAACVNRALGAGERTPEQERGHFRQALFSLVFGGGAWLLSAVAFVVLGVFAAAAGTLQAQLLAGVVIIGVLTGNVLLGALGVGQAVAALRTRGSHMILATIGLIIGGLYIGAIQGFLLFVIWQG